MQPTVHVAITRIVKPGCEKDFERAILKFFAQSAASPGVLGAQLIRPIPGSTDQTYGIIRSFASADERDAFYRSEAFAQWQQAVQPLVAGDCQRRPLHGLEAFFADPGVVNHPPRWKMAITTWLGVWPTVFIVSEVLGQYLRPLPAVVATGAATSVVVVILAWLVMPFLTRFLRPWLRARRTVDEGGSSNETAAHSP